MHPTNNRKIDGTQRVKTNIEINTSYAGRNLTEG
jgi:hypothetical protein